MVMTKKSRGLRSGTRKTLSKDRGQKRKAGAFLKQFQPGDKVTINIDPAYQQGMPAPKYQGKVGTIVERRGKSYVVKLAGKQLTTHPIHLKVNSNEHENH